MFGELVLEVPVYRVSPEEWSAEGDEIDRSVKDAYIRQLPPGMEPNPESVAHHVAVYQRIIGRNVPYLYNLVVGWVRLECDHRVLKAEAYRVSQKRIMKQFRTTKAAHYEWAGKVMERWFHQETSLQIADEIREQLLGLTKRGAIFARRWLDLEAFDTLAPHVDWRGLLSISDRAVAGL
jgi:hypothetical protein